MTQHAVLTYRRLLSRWENFWFREVPPHTYALLRIAFGIFGIVGLVGLTPVSMFWPLDGINPLPGHGFGLRAELFTLGLGTIVGWIFFCGSLLFFLAMTVGYLTQFVVPLCFVCSVLLTFWNHLPLSSAHQVVVAVLFCLVWADVSAVWSIDAWRAARRQDRRNITAAPTHAIWPLRLIQFQVALIYLNSGLWKLFGPSWRDGSAVHDAMNLNVFHRFPYVIPGNLEWLLTVATYFTLFWEIGFAFMLLHRWTRRAALILGVLLHIGLWVSLELGPFSWIMIATYVAFIDPCALSKSAQRWLARESDGPAVAV